MHPLSSRLALIPGDHHYHCLCVCLGDSASSQSHSGQRRPQRAIPAHQASLVPEPLRPTLSSDSDANDESDEEEAERGKHLEQERLDVRVLHVGVGVDLSELKVGLSGSHMDLLADHRRAVRVRRSARMGLWRL
jgi:hypothetical protein